MTTSVQQRMRELSGSNYIANQWQPSSGKLIDLIDPATEEVVGQFANATKSEVDAAVAAANAAQKLWWAMSALDRANAMHQVADRMIEGNRIGKVARLPPHLGTTPKLQGMNKDALPVPQSLAKFTWLSRNRLVRLSRSSLTTSRFF
ncbi:MAG: aldehyde dehydrogenase family protein [Actinobacteria bacterium]|nr:aldehyde dehydrogenase family protein [Actinomycetota bacterium]